MNPLRFDLCKNLRWKSHSRDSGDPAAILESLRRQQVPFDCLSTCQPWGPDDDIVSPGACGKERTCFVQSRLVEPPIT